MSFSFAMRGKKKINLSFPVVLLLSPISPFQDISRPLLAPPLQVSTLKVNDLSHLEKLYRCSPPQTCVHTNYKLTEF